MRARLGDAFKMFDLEQRPLEALALLCVVVFPISKRQRRLESIFDLAPILVARLLVHVVKPMLFSKFADLVFGKIHLKTGLTESQEAALPNSQDGVSIKFGVVETNMNTGSKCFVEFSHAVGRQDDDS